MNAIISLEGIIDNFADLIEIKPFLVVLQNETGDSHSPIIVKGTLYSFL